MAVTWAAVGSYYPLNMAVAPVSVAALPYNEATWWGQDKNCRINNACIKFNLHPTPRILMVGRYANN
jgi:hypothetical protein